MAEFSYPWGVDSTDAAAADSRLYQGGWRELVGGTTPDCVVFDRSNLVPANAPLYVSAGGTNKVISVAAGSAVVQGALYDNTAAKTFDLSTIGTQPSTGQSRTDRVVLRYVPGASPASTRLSVQMVTGAPATTGSQTVPSLTQSTALTTGTWEVEIARVTWASGSNVTQANITQLHPRPLAPVWSTNAPGNPAMRQMWMAADYSTWIWNGTTWVYNGGGPAPTAGAHYTSGQVLNTSGYTLITLSPDTWNSNQACRPMSGQANRLQAIVPGVFRYHMTCRPNNTGGSAAATLWQFRKNAGGSASGGTALEGMYDTAVAGAYVVMSFSGEVSMAANDYIELFGYSSTAGATVNIDGQGGTQGRVTLTWLGTS